MQRGYTFWSDQGKVLRVGNACAANYSSPVDRRTRLWCITMVEKEDSWDYVIHSMRAYLIELGCEKIRLRRARGASARSHAGKNRPCLS